MKPQDGQSLTSLRKKTGVTEMSKKPSTTFSDIFKQTPEKILARKEERYKSIKKASFTDIIKSPSTTTEVSKAPEEEGQRRSSESRGMRRVEETSRVQRIEEQPPSMRRIDETLKSNIAEDFGKREEEAQRRWEEEQERRWALEEKKWEEEDERRRLMEERKWEEERRREERMWEEQERRRWEQEQERRNRRRVDVEKPQVDEVNRRPLTQVNRRRLDIQQQQPALEEVRLVHRPITARSIGDSLERADHHPGKYQRVKPDQTQNPGAFGPPADQRSIEAAVAAGAAAYHAVSAIFVKKHILKMSQIYFYFQDGHEPPKRLSFQIHGQEGPNSYRFGYDTGLG